MEAVDRTLASMNRLPGVAVPEVSGELDVIALQLGSIDAGIDGMRTAVSEADFDGAKVQNAAATASDSLSYLESALKAWQSRIGATLQATSNVSGNVPRWIDLTSTALTLLVILFG